MEKNSVLIILSGERLLNHYFLSLIKTLIISSFSLRATILHGHPLLHAVSWKLEFQRPQISDLSRAHVSHHVRLHVLVHMSMLQCRKSVCLCVVYVYACKTVLCLPWASCCGENAKVTCKNTFWGQRSKVVSNVYTLRSASLLCQIKTCLSITVCKLPLRSAFPKLIWVIATAFTLLLHCHLVHCYHTFLFLYYCTRHYKNHWWWFELENCPHANGCINKERFGRSIQKMSVAIFGRAKWILQPSHIDIMNISKSPSVWLTDQVLSDISHLVRDSWVIHLATGLCEGNTIFIWTH